MAPVSFGDVYFRSYSSGLTNIRICCKETLIGLYEIEWIVNVFKIKKMEVYHEIKIHSYIIVYVCAVIHRGTQRLSVVCLQLW